MSSNFDETDHSKSHGDNTKNMHNLIPATGDFQQVDKIRVAETRNGSGGQIQNSTGNKTDWVKFEDDDDKTDVGDNNAKDFNEKIVLDSSLADPLSVAAAKVDNSIPVNVEQVHFFI